MASCEIHVNTLRRFIAGKITYKLGTARCHVRLPEGIDVMGKFIHGPSPWVSQRKMGMKLLNNDHVLD